MVDGYYVYMSAYLASIYYGLGMVFSIFYGLINLMMREEVLGLEFRESSFSLVLF